MSCGKPVFVFQRAFPIFRDDLDVARRKPKVSNVSAYAAVSAQVTKAEIEDWRSRQKDLVERGKYADSVVRKNIRRERTEYIVKIAPAESNEFEDSLIDPSLSSSDLENMENPEVSEDAFNQLQTSILSTESASTSLTGQDSTQTIGSDEAVFSEEAFTEEAARVLMVAEDPMACLTAEHWIEHYAQINAVQGRPFAMGCVHEKGWVVREHKWSTFSEGSFSRRAQTLALQM